MARYFFDLHECGDITSDEEGLEAEDLDAARTLAVTAVRDIMAREVQEGNLCLSCFIEIRDENHAVRDRIMFRDAIRISGL